MEKVRVCKVSGSSDMPNWIRYNIPDFLEGMPIAVFTKDRKVGKEVKMRNRLEKLGETEGIGMCVVEKAYRRLQSTNPDIIVLEKRTNSRFVDNSRIR